MTASRHVLIIEDQESLRRAITMAFSKEGYYITEASDGFEGLRMALTGKPDLILLDIMMPKVDGLSMLKELRKDEWGKDAKVVLLTNMLDDEEMLETAAELGVTSFMLKAEWSLKDVTAKAKQALELV